MDSRRLIVDDSGSEVAGLHEGPRISDQQSSALSAPHISLPKGGGAIRGIGEKFGVNPATGTGSLTVPIFTSAGRSGFGPQLSISYDSGAGNGPFGFGWSLGLPSITRKTDKGLPRYHDAQESDTFILSGAEDLVPLLVKRNGSWERDVSTRVVYGLRYGVHRYRPRVEGLFSRIERWVSLADPQDTFWRSISKNNVTTWYGRTAESRIADPADPARIFTWLICESHDDKGNVMAYRYKPEDSEGVDLSQAHERNRSTVTRSANRYLKRVLYGNRAPYLPDLTRPQPVTLPNDWCFELVFDYGEHHATAPVPHETGTPWDCRADPFSTYRATFEVRTYRLCRRALMFHHFPEEPDVGPDCLVRSTDFTHAAAVRLPADASKPFYSFLRSATQSGYRRNRDGGYFSESMPPLEFGYSEAEIDETVREVHGESLENLPYGVDGTRYRWVDLDGEGLSGILTEEPGSWYYRPNLSRVNQRGEKGSTATLVRFGPLQPVTLQPSLAALRSGRQQLLDLSGHGRLDLVQYDGPIPGYFERTSDEGWEPFTPFTALPTVDWKDPNLKFVDLTGNGFADLLISEEEAFWWYGSRAAAGFEQGERVSQVFDEEQGPKLIFADGTETVFLADLSGDGLTDLVRVRNGEVCYWPNLGYGRFGAKVSMDGAPWLEEADLFDGRRIRLADLDGSGTADLVYFASGGIQLYFNQSGNAWGERRALEGFPPVESLSSAVIFDLLGNGTACLVWSSPLPDNARRPMRYVELMGGQKPHLLVRVVNNLGAETRVQYAPSTQFYVSDKLAGTPWYTRIPFPVHVVERVETYDRISRNRFVSLYAYHHGYYDGVEREFRGFGRVDQWDTEEFATLTEGGALPQAANIDVASHVPPVWTKTWFHTGAYIEEAGIAKHFEGEYYREGDAREALAGLTNAQLEAMLLPDTVLPATLWLPDGSRQPYTPSAEETREACRALRGSILRQEIYALDGSDASDRPYSTSERSYTIELLQPQGPNRYAVFFTHAREIVDLYYERELFTVAGTILADRNTPRPNARILADPRATHNITLAVDQFGNTLQSVSVGYGRRYIDPALKPEDQARQRTTLSTYMENKYTNSVLEGDAYRAPLPAETSTYELVQVRPDATEAGVTNLFRFDEARAKILAASDGQHDIPYENLDTTGLQAGQPYRRLIERVRTVYRPNDMGAAAGNPMSLLPPGRLESLALPGAIYKLTFTPGLVPLVYRRDQETLLPDPAAVLSSSGSDGGSYVDLDGDGHWWIPSGRVFCLPAPASPQQERNEALQHFFLLGRFEDPFGNPTTVAYDPHDLLPVNTVDTVGNAAIAVNDYRVLQPTLLADPNGNRSAVSFDALGLVAGTAVMGKTTDNLGDSIDGFTADLTQTQINDFYRADDPHTLAAALLGTATSRTLHDIGRFFRTYSAAPDDSSKWEPVFAATLTRLTHESDLGPNQQTSRVQVSFSYSDGFGREIQRKVQGEPGPVVDGGPTINPRWVASGWTIFNNKGKPVRQYEPFFSRFPAKGHQFEFDVQAGVSRIVCYDPTGRNVATLRPNHTYQKVIFSPWQQVTWDVNDTVLQADPKADPDVGDFFRRLPDGDYLPTWHSLRTDPSHASQAAQLWPDPAVRAAESDAAVKAAAHANTPAVAHLDPLGRTFLTVVNNAGDGKYPTRIELDIEGNQRSVRDELGRTVMVYDYDMLGNRIHQASMEAGERWMLNDATGKPIRAWDSRGHTFRMAYDALRRSTDSFMREGAGADLLVSRSVYGEGRPNPEVNNLRGKVIRLFDQAGVVASDRYDFKGNLLRTQRQLAQSYTSMLDWSATVPLQAETYTGHRRFDALNRPIQLIAPHSDQAGAGVNVVEPIYNEANLLEQVHVWPNEGAEPAGWLDPATATLHAVTNIDYDARGQRRRIDYGNGASTVYGYDPLTFRLAHIVTRRGAEGFPDDCPQPPPPGWPGCGVQSLHYTYDPVGNVTRIRDNAQQTVYFRNRRVEPSTDYAYDAVYRLVEATGREHLGQVGGAPNPHSYNDAPQTGLPHPNDGGAMGAYIERYQYDAAGNFLQMQHRGSDPADPGWTRTYAYGEASELEPGSYSNRLSSTTVGSNNPIAEQYGYDAHGNLLHMPNLQVMQWDFKDQLRMTQRQAVNAGDADGVQHQGERTYYVYDSAGQRVRKVTELRMGQVKDERIYLGGFEVYRKNGANPLVRETLHVMDNQQRIALVERRTRGTDPGPPQLVRYQLGNHLGSASLELDDKAQIISYEEYTPYGSTSYQAARSQTETPKRYRYTGKERDEESGLYYHRARYYAPWLGRWISADPSTTKDGLNLFAFVHNRPLNLVDPSGNEAQPDPMNYATFEDYSEAMQAVGVPWREGYPEEEWGRAAQRTDQRLQDVHTATVDPAQQARAEMEEDLRRLHNVQTPWLSFILPTHVAPYLRDQTIGIHNPYLRWQAEVNQRSGEAIARFTNRLGMAAIAFYGGGMALSFGAAIGVELAGPSVLAGGARIAAAYQEAGIYIGATFPKITAFVTAAAAGFAGVQAPSSAGAPAAQGASSSIWRLNPFVRGRLIERMLGGNLPSNFPTIDKVVQGTGIAAQEITSIKSLDLGAASYQSGTAVLSRLTQYIDKLASFTGRNWAGVNVTVGQSTQRVLEVGIPATGATQAQLNQIAQAAQYAAQQGINMVVRVFQ